MKTTDFSGTYDYEREEAAAEVASLAEYADEYTREELAARIARTRAHWARVLDGASRDDFMRHFDAGLRAAGLAD